MKIAIIGNAGSGKSTLGVQLHQKLNIPLYHLDQYFWKPGWQEPDRRKFEEIHTTLCDQDEWIIEGMAARYVEYRVAQADVVIYLDVPTHVCLYRIFKRAILYFGSVHFAQAKDCPERGPSLKFLKYVLNFNKTRRPLIEAVLLKHRHLKKLFIIKSRADLRTLMENIGSSK